MSESACHGDSSNCQSHFHDEDPKYLADASPTHLENDPELGRDIASVGPGDNKESRESQNTPRLSDKRDVGFRRIIRNFTPSYVQALLMQCERT